MAARSRRYRSWFPIDDLRGVIAGAVCCSFYTCFRKQGREGLQTLTWGYVATGQGHGTLFCIGYRRISMSEFADLGLLKTVLIMIVELVLEPSRVCYLCLPRAGKDHNSTQTELSVVGPITSQPPPVRCQVAI